jgi:hypothetical protein
MPVPITGVVRARNIWKLVVSINSVLTLRGYQEVYCPGISQDLVGASPAYAITAPACAYFLSARAMLLGAGSEIVWARLSTTGASHNGLSQVIPSPTGILRAAESPLQGQNLAGDAVVFRSQSASGKSGSRGMKSVRDGDIVTGAFQVDTSTFNPADPLATVFTGLTAVEQWKIWMGFLCNWCFRARYLRTENQFEVEPWSSVTFRRCASRRLGKPWGAWSLSRI